MPIVIHRENIERTCDHCQTSILGLIECRCAPTVRIYCPQHACECNGIPPEGDRLQPIQEPGDCPF